MKKSIILLLAISVFACKKDETETPVPTPDPKPVQHEYVGKIIYHSVWDTSTIFYTKSYHSDPISANNIISDTVCTQRHQLNFSYNKYGEFYSTSGDEGIYGKMWLTKGYSQMTDTIVFKWKAFDNKPIRFYYRETGGYITAPLSQMANQPWIVGGINVYPDSIQTLTINKFCFYK